MEPKRGQEELTHQEGGLDSVHQGPQQGDWGQAGNFHPWSHCWKPADVRPVLSAGHAAVTHSVLARGRTDRTDFLQTITSVC